MSWDEEKQKVDKLIYDLQGTCQTLGDDICERHGLEYPMSKDAHLHLDQEIFECGGCGWWCERSEEARDVPGMCDDCEPEGDED